MGWETSPQTLADLARSRGLNPAKHRALCGQCGALSEVGMITHGAGCDGRSDSIHFQRVKPAHRD